MFIFIIIPSWHVETVISISFSFISCKGIIKAYLKKDNKFTNKMLTLIGKCCSVVIYKLLKLMCIEPKEEK